MIRLLSILGLVLAPIAVAEVTVSVEISGTVDEITQILEVLKELGIGSPQSAKTEDGLPVNVHSLLDRPLEAGAPEEPAPPAPLAFLAAQTLPEQVRPGSEVLITLQVSDPDGKIDTIVALRSGAVETEYDLFDNGKRGDAVAYDGIWSLALPIAPDAEPGTYIVSFVAFDDVGEQVLLGKTGDENRRPLTLRTTFEVTP